MTGAWNYLRVRGEYFYADNENVYDAELPPRARRIHPIGLDGDVPTGTTSACAENTPHSSPLGANHGNYLRVRGEYFDSLKESVSGEELPPRARRIQRGHGTLG